MKTYLNIFKKAKGMLEKKQIELTNVKETSNEINYFFKIKNYNTTLTFTKLNNTKTSVWKKSYMCDCRATAIRGTEEMCSHIISCITYLTIKS